VIRAKKFAVDSNGVLYAFGAEIAGKFTATNGNESCTMDSDAQGAYVSAKNSVSGIRMSANHDGSVGLYEVTPTSGGGELIEVLWERTGTALYTEKSVTVGYLTSAPNNGVSIGADGTISANRATGQALVYASNSSEGNRIFIYADASSGQAGLYSYSADGTARPILVRANNSNAIATYGDWGFIPWKKDIRGTPIISDSSDGHRVSLLTCGASGQVGIQAQFGSTGTTYSIGYFNVAASDIRLKKNIKDSTVKALPLINDIKIREFDWKDGRHQTIGMVADELEELDENLTMGGGYTEDGEMSIKSVDTFHLVGYLTKAVQELSAKVEQLEARVKELEEGKKDVGVD
jgi:hypothetical protein